MKTKIGHFHDRLIESRNKLARIEDKRHQISLTEGLLQTCEQLPERDLDNERRLRAKLRAKKCQLQAMCPL